MDTLIDFEDIKALLDRLKQLTNPIGVQLRLPGLKAYSSLSIGERLHEPLRRIYNKVGHDYPTVENSLS